MLQERFKNFLETLEGVENIDNLDLTPEQRDAGKADYFAKDRNVIIELKSLETDTEPKVEKILESHRSRAEFPDFYGEIEVYKVLNHLPDGKEIAAKLTDAVTSSLEEIYRKANKQIRTTKSTFELSASQGVLIILNEKIDILSPEYIAYRLRKTAAKKTPEKQYQFTNISVILIITEAHFVPMPGGIMAFPIVEIPISVGGNFIHSDFLTRLKEKWTEYNNVPFIKGSEIKTSNDLSVAQSVQRFKKDTTKTAPRHEIWRRNYNRNPYFRSYDTEKLKWIFGIIMEEGSPGLLKGSTKEERDRVNFWMEIFTHFLEEINHRGLDMKNFAKITEDVMAKISTEMEKRFPIEK